MRQCWCGNTKFVSFSPQYNRCINCQTLVSSESLTDAQLVVEDDDKDFYGKQYWLGHQQQDLGFPNIYARARNDLTERNLHWLKVLLKYVLPPSSVLELGCSHGSFVALTMQAGYEASGVEMSPWVVDFGKENFQVPIYTGPVETLNIPPQSLDAIALMDVLEHLPDPISTLSHCMSLLKEDGCLLIQTPEFKEEMSYESLVDSHAPFLDQLKSQEHLYLFSQQSITQFLRQIGAQTLHFEPAIFSHYDMFLVAGKTELKQYTYEQSEESLLKTSRGRFVVALLQLRARELNLLNDRARFRQQLKDLSAKFQQADSDRVARLEQIQTLTKWLEESRQSTQDLEQALEKVNQELESLRQKS